MRVECIWFRLYRLRHYGTEIPGFVSLVSCIIVSMNPTAKSMAMVIQQSTT